MITQQRTARWPGTCYSCGKAFPAGTKILWSSPDRARGESGKSHSEHVTCASPTPGVTPPPLPPITIPGGPKPEPDADVEPADEQPNDATPQPEPLPPLTPSGNGLADVITDEVWRRIEPRVRAVIPDSPTPNAKPIRKRITIVERPNAEPIEIENTHPSFARLLKYAERRQHCYLVGAAGSGKGHTAQQLANALNLPFRYVGLTPATMPTALFGHTLATDADRVVRTAFRECWEHGGVLLLDEPDNARDDMIAGLNGALAARLAEFPDVAVPQHPDCLIIAAANTPGLGGTSQYPSRRRLDAAFRSRFAFLDWSYDRNLEFSVARSYAPSSIPQPAVDAWVEWILAVRAFVETRFPTVIITPRASYNGAALLDVEPVKALADALVFQGLDANMQREMLTACPLPNIVIEAAS